MRSTDRQIDRYSTLQDLYSRSKISKRVRLFGKKKIVARADSRVCSQDLNDSRVNLFAGFFIGARRQSLIRNRDLKDKRVNLCGRTFIGTRGQSCV